jgi:hypothetical protein
MLGTEEGNVFGRAALSQLLPLLLLSFGGHDDE